MSWWWSGRAFLIRLAEDSLVTQAIKRVGMREGKSFEEAWWLCEELLSSELVLDVSWRSEREERMPDSMAVPRVPGRY